MEASPDVLLPLLAITVLVLLLSLPNIRLVYQVYNFVNVLIISPTGVFQISKNKLKVSLIDNSLLLCLLTSGVIDTFFNFFNLRLNLSELFKNLHKKPIRASRAYSDHLKQSPFSPAKQLSGTWRSLRPSHSGLKHCQMPKAQQIWGLSAFANVIASTIS